ncbi:MAG: TolC family protein [Fluviicola sp.]|jgi:outer membrane protein TolC
MKTVLSTLLVGFSFFSLKAQDTIREITLDQYLAQLREHHPVALIAANNVSQAEQIVRMSKGAFDPVLFGGIDQKYYEGKTYYSTINSGLKIPTRLGWDFKVMGDWNRGTYLNAEQVVPEDGLTYVGVDIPIGRGMFTDERRTQLKRAGVAYNQSILERQLALNDLLYEAGQQFIYWQEQYMQLQLAEEGFRFAQLRYEQSKANAAIGERASIDTVEASAQLYLRQLDIFQRRLNVQNARLGVENYMWEQGKIPLRLDTIVVPAPLALEAPSLNVNDSVQNHPILQWYGLKTSDLQLERKLKLEQLKPQFNVQYNLLQTPQDLVSFNYSINNYKWGATMYMPILLRKERSSLQITNIKLENVALEQAQKQRDLSTKQQQVRNELLTVNDQANTAFTIAQRYRQLAEAERQLFELGESSLFLINAREISYLSAQGKYLEFLAKNQKALLSEKFVLGILGY